ncbi:MAG: hypothetical protein ACJ74J_06870 [Blastocatellia bacterium]
MKYRLFRIRHPHLPKLLVLFPVIGCLIFVYARCGSKGNINNENSNSKGTSKIVAVQPPPTPKSPPPPAPPPPKPEPPPPPPPPPKSSLVSSSQFYHPGGKLGLISAYDILVVPGDWYNTRIRFDGIHWFLFNYIEDTFGHLEMSIGDQNWNFDLPLTDKAYYEFWGSRVNAQPSGKLRSENEGKYVMFRATENPVRLHCEVYIQH